MKFAEMTAPRIRALSRENTLFVQPIAALEQHGPHLATGTDIFIGTAVAEAVEARHRESLVLLPTQWLGASAHHLRFGATSTAELDTYIELLCQMARPLLRDGYRRFLLLNSHGGNTDPLRVALRQLHHEFPSALLSGAPYWSIAGEVIAEHLEGDHKFVGHACEFETSMIMHLRPELVDSQELRDAGPLGTDDIEGLFLPRDMKDRTREGCTGRPDLASADKGKVIFEGIVERVSTAVEKILNEPLPA